MNKFKTKEENVEYVEGYSCPVCFDDNTETYVKTKKQSCLGCGYEFPLYQQEIIKLTDLEMAKKLVDYGYDVELDELKATFNTLIVAEMAVNEGFKWNDTTDLWE